MRVSSTGLPFLLPPEAGLVSPSAGVSLWLLSPGAVDAQKGLPRWHSSSSSSAAAVCSVQGSGARAIPPRDGLRALKLVFIPRPDRLSPNLFLFSFSSGATGFFFPPNQSDRERVARGERCPCLRKDWKGRKGCLLGSWPGQPAGWRWSSCILDASLFRLCAFHTHTHTALHSCSHTPLFHAPPGRSCLPVPPPPPVPVPAAPLPGSGSHTGNHSFPLCA